MRLFAAFVSLLLLAACSGQPQIVNPNKTPAEARSDYDECQGRAAVVVAILPKGKDVEGQRAKALDDCMHAKGYRVEGK